MMKNFEQIIGDLKHSSRAQSSDQPKAGVLEFEGEFQKRDRNNLMPVAGRQNQEIQKLEQWFPQSTSSGARNAQVYKD